MELQQWVSMTLSSTYKVFRTAVSNINVLDIHVKCLTFQSDFKYIWSFSTDFRKSPQNQIFTKLRPAGAVLVNEDRQKDKQTDG
jgi:hypothetical protein